MRRVLAASVALCASIVVALAVDHASGEDAKVEQAPGFQVSRSVQERAGAVELVVFSPTEVERPSMTGDSAYLRYECFAASGRPRVAIRQPWPPETPYHFHWRVPSEIVRKLDRCRLTGTAAPFETTILEGPRDGSHPPSPRREPEVTFDPFESE